MKNIRTEILINRDITNVWDVLMNFESYLNGIHLSDQ